MPSQFTNPLMQQLQGMQWIPPMSNMNPFFTGAALMQNSPWSQSQQLPPNGVIAVLPLQRNQSQQAGNALSTALGNGIYVDTTPVGSADDDPCLAKALYNSIDKGQTYKQAIEGLHGVSRTRVLHLFIG
jgi:predicted component of type VI protein secretion system